MIKSQNNKKNRYRKKSSTKKNNLSNQLISLIGIGVFLMIAQKFIPISSLPIIRLATKPDCKIKGNISQSSGKKYYHVPIGEIDLVYLKSAIWIL